MTAHVGHDHAIPVGGEPLNVLDGVRQNAALAYLTADVRQRPNLMIRGDVTVDRVLFSVDYPFSPMEDGRRFLDSLPLAPADVEKIAHGNADRLLKL